MSDSAKIDDIDALKLFRRALHKFAEAANVSLGDAESEMNRVLLWLETEHRSYWEFQMRSRRPGPLTTCAITRATSAPTACR